MKTSQFHVPLDLVRNNPNEKIHSIESSRFKEYGRILHDFDATELVSLADRVTTIPEQDTTYETYLPALEETSLMEELKLYYGGQDIQIGYCNGKNQCINGMEYHKSPELFIAVTDCLQFLTPFSAMQDYDSVDTTKAELFYFPKGSVTIVDANVLHFAPCAVSNNGFKSIIVLPRGTNEPLEEKMKAVLKRSNDPESRLLINNNKWLIAHPEREKLIKQGVHAGLRGPNRRVIPVS
ncbi:DUF4867 family protein [uncultured Sphaerochaeta sp.]|uniref:DUF4867 family protein n=1 Tax=uncultured Sphaerochaeta sp. TaxID=886478 RepID=UPI0029CA9277|nr:DUF4867 family protein [uncultured Sphaerochaeta sp.]